MLDWVNNRCGGVRWRSWPNGLVEVEGQGFPAYQVDSAVFVNLARTWSNWGGLFRAAAKRYAIPVSWVAAIAATESGPWSTDPEKQASVVSYDNGVGIMQITNYPGTTAQQMLDPSANIYTGAMILGKAAVRLGYELPEVAAAYNAGDVYCSPGNNEWNMRSTGDYSGSAVRFNNAAILYLRVNDPSLFGYALGGVAVAALALGGWWYAHHVAAFEAPRG